MTEYLFDCWGRRFHGFTEHSDRILLYPIPRYGRCHRPLEGKVAMVFRSSFYLSIIP